MTLCCGLRAPLVTSPREGLPARGHTRARSQGGGHSGTFQRGSSSSSSSSRAAAAPHAGAHHVHLPTHRPRAAGLSSQRRQW